MAAMTAGAFTVWLTGLSGAGKTTIGRIVVDRLHEQGAPAVLLDGDEIRQHLTRELGYSRADRDQQVERVGWLCELLNREGVNSVVALVSPYRAARDEVRARIPRFFEVHVDAPVPVLEQRDPKGYYRRARDGRMAGLTGVDDPYEPPERPELVCLTDGSAGPETCAHEILRLVGGGSNWGG